MTRESTWRNVSLHNRAKFLEARWQELCAVYLPRASEDSIWRYDLGRGGQGPSSGWKLHVSATILNAPKVLRKVAPLLVAHGVSFKAPRSLFEVGQLNSGLSYNYSQVGKIITVYPGSDDEAVFLAQRLHRLTHHLPAPVVPFDLRFSDTSNVYYRFGAFEHLELTENHQTVPAIRAPDGTLIPDIREQPKPDWVTNPFSAHEPRSRSGKQKAVSSIRIMKVLAQRGKGGVYEALDLSSGKAQLCLLKEGRKNGELTWDGRDGAWRVRNEKRVLAHLAACVVPVPRVHSSFEIDGNYYLLMEYLDGDTLHQALARRRRRLSLPRVLDYGLQIAKFMSQMHGAGWVWRDCKPKNIIVTRAGHLVPIDFEGAALIHRPDPLRWSTPSFTSPEPHGFKVRDGVADDLYALGSVLFLLLTGRLYDPAQPLAIRKLRRNIPPKLCELVESLLAREPEARPSGKAVRARLTSILLNSKRQPARLAAVPVT